MIVHETAFFHTSNNRRHLQVGVYTCQYRALPVAAVSGLSAFVSAASVLSVSVAAGVCLF